MRFENMLFFRLIERRTPLTPSNVRRLVREGYKVLVQPSDIRFFTDGSYEKAGAKLVEDLSPANVILGVKEVPVDDLIPGRTYVSLTAIILVELCRSIDAWNQLPP
jgi:NAD/NADP transhydrogenase alpha subunit